MPRPNPERSLQSEAALARRVKWERERRNWTFEGLAKRMTDAGCPIQGSAIYKIEKGDPPRRITVDELVAFGKVFDLDVPELLLPPEVVVDERLRAIAGDVAQALEGLWYDGWALRTALGRVHHYMSDDQTREQMAQAVRAVVTHAIPDFAESEHLAQFPGEDPREHGYMLAFYAAARAWSEGGDPWKRDDGAGG